MDRLSVWDDEKVLEIDSGDVCKTMWMCLIPLNSTFKVIKIVNFIFYVYFAIIKNKIHLQVGFDLGSVIFRSKIVEDDLTYN